MVKADRTELKGEHDLRILRKYTYQVISVSLDFTSYGNPNAYVHGECGNSFHGLAVMWIVCRFISIGGVNA